MAVLYTVLVLSVIAGQSFVFAENAAANATTAAPENSTTAAVPSTTATPPKPEQPPSNAASPVKEPSATKKGDESKTNEDEDAPMADDSDSVDKKGLATTLERITNVLDTNPSGKGTVAVPLVPGKNFDFFLLKVAKLGDQQKATEKPSRDMGRSLELATKENQPSSLQSIQPNSLSLQQRTVPTQPGPCVCSVLPPQVAPNLQMLQGIYGNALTLGGILDQGCPPGMVALGPGNAINLNNMPAINSIPVQGAYGLGQGYYNQYSPNGVPAGSPPIQTNYYPLDSANPGNAFKFNSMPAFDGIPVHGAYGFGGMETNSLDEGYGNQYSPNAAPDFPQIAANYQLQNTNPGLPPYPLGAAIIPPAYPQLGVSAPLSYPQLGTNQPLLYITGELNIPYSQNAYNVPPVPPYQPLQQGLSGIAPYGLYQQNWPLTGPLLSYGEANPNFPLAGNPSYAVKSQQPSSDISHHKSAKSLNK